MLFFIFYYVMYFFLKDGKAILEKVLYYIPMNAENTQKILDSFLKVSKATIKGTVVIGIIQGIAAGIGFAIAGVPGWLFWMVIMIIFSIIPVIGSSIVWIPVCLVMLATGHATAAILLGLYCAIFVTNIDNFLRPRLVGKDSGMSEVLVLLSTF